MEETKKLSCIDCNVKKCNVKQNIENHKPYPGFCVSHNMDLKDRQMALDTYLGDEKDRNCKLCGTLKGKPPAGRTFERIRL